MAAFASIFVKLPLTPRTSIYIHNGRLKVSSDVVDVK
jgi:hypothetical protein